MDDTERYRLDGAILEAAKPYEAFVDAVLAHAKDAFRRGAKQVRIVFYPQGAMSISDDGRELTEKQFLAMTTLRENRFKSAHERLGLAFIEHAAWLEVFSGSRKNQTRLPSTEGFCQMCVPPNRTGNVTIMFHEMRGRKNDAMTVLRLLPSKLLPSQVDRVTVVDARGMEWKLRKVGQSVLAERLVALPDSFGTAGTLFQEDLLMLVVGRICVRIREVLDKRSPRRNDAEAESFEPLRSPWLTGVIHVIRKDFANEFPTNTVDFPPEAYADGTVDAILGEIEKAGAVVRAQAAIVRIAATIPNRMRERPFTVRGTTYLLKAPESYGRGTQSVWINAFQRDAKVTEISSDPMHPVFQADARPDAIFERLLWCVTDLIRGDVPAQVIYLELRAAIDANRMH